MKCKDCVREKKCPDKNKKDRPQDCGRFISYEDSEKFEVYDLMMRTNKGIIGQID